MSKLARALALAAMLAAMSLAPLTAVAQTHAADQPTGHDVRRPPTQGQVGEYWRDRRASSASAAQAAADTAHRRLLAQERSLTPSGSAAQLPDVVRPAEPGWLTPALAALAVLALAAGVAVTVVRRANRRQGAGQTA